MFFGHLIKDTIRLFASIPCAAIELPGSFAKAVSPGHEGDLVLENHFFKVAEYGELRIAHTYAPKISIVAVFFFPNPHYQLPTYSMEFVLLGQKPIVALMDLLCLNMPMSTSRTVKAIMAAAHQDYPAESQAREMPAWFDECRSGLEFFYKPATQEEFKRLGQVHLQLAGQLLALFAEAEHFCQSSAAQHKQYLDQYKRHHSLNSPGIRLMNRSFGEAWTAQYLCDYLFF